VTSSTVSASVPKEIVAARHSSLRPRYVTDTVRANGVGASRGSQLPAKSVSRPFGEHEPLTFVLVELSRT
jgi:hypothetical protein